MKIKILHLIEGAKKAEGLTVIIDVFRAFTVACYAFDNGAKKVIPVGELDHAYSLKADIDNSILIGERGGKKMPGCDFGNSPTHIKDIDFSGKTIIHTTSAGTQGIVNATKASEVITGSFVNANAIIEYIKLKKPNQVSLVCMGNAGIAEAEEDNLCAEYIKNALINNEYMNEEEIKDKLRNNAGQRFFDIKNKDWSPESDFELCTQLDIFKFVLKVQTDEHGLLYLNKVGVEDF